VSIAARPHRLVRGPATALPVQWKLQIPLRVYAAEILISMLRRSRRWMWRRHGGACKFSGTISDKNRLWNRI